MKNIILLFLYLSFNVLPVQAALSLSDFEQSRLQDIAKTPTWLKLLHMEPGAWGSHYSDLDPSFFLAQNGQKEPLAELEASLDLFLKAFELEAKEEENPKYCIYPARLQFLNQILNFDSENKLLDECTKFLRFREQLQAKSVSLIFSSYYLGSSASTFGHSLLRFNRSLDPHNENRLALLDIGINFGANIDDSTNLFSSLQALWGGLPASFSSMPYYYKVREYNGHESRDLWEYRLRFTPDQVNRMVAHLWELGNIPFSYSFLTKNCSYQLLWVLDVGDESLNLVKRQNLFVIPSDTVGLIYQTPGLVNEVKLRPSNQRIFQSRVKSLKAKELVWFQTRIDQLDESIKQDLPRARLPDDFSKESKMILLDAEADYLDYKYQSKLLDKKSAAHRLMQESLLERSQNNLISPELKVSEQAHAAPHEAHGSRRFMFSSGYDRIEEKFSLGFAYRFALHDLLDIPYGYPELASIEVMNAQINLFPSSSLKNFSAALQKLEIIGISNFEPLTQVDSKYSYAFHLGLERRWLSKEQNALNIYLNYARGYSLGFFKQDRLLLTSLFQGRVDWMPGVSNLGLHLAPKLGLLWRPCEWMKAYLEAEHRFPLLFSPGQRSFLSIGLRLAPTNDRAFGFQIQHDMESLGGELQFFWYH